MAEHFFAQTDTGRVRDNNEDTFIAQYSADKQYIIASVIDGVGGYHGGEVAAAIAKEEFINALTQNNDSVVAAVVNAFKQASTKIYTEKQADKQHAQMACVATLVLADVEHNKFTYAHVGDTRLYLLRDGSLVKITKDHSFVGYLEDTGRLTESAAMKHPKRNEINKALGFSEEIDTDDTYIETGESPFLPGDILLICSDGLTDMVEKNTITQIVSGEGSLQQKVAVLIDEANKNGGNDNVTVVLVKNNKKPKQINATRPSSVEKRMDEINGENEPDISVESQPNINDQLPQKKSNALTMLLGIICLVLLASSIWLYTQWKGNQPKVTAGVQKIKVQRNEQKLLLQDAFDNVNGDTLILSDTVFKSPVLISDTLFIKADTLFVKTKGKIVLQADTGYNGPALVIAPNARLTVLDSLEFRDFATAIYLNNTALQLKKTRFVNSIAPVVNRYNFDKKASVNAKIPVLVMPVDSVTNRTKPANGKH